MRFQISSISSSAFSANEILYWLLVNACVGNIENAREESIIPTENDAKSNPNTIIGDRVIIANSLEEGCYREVVSHSMTNATTRESNWEKRSDFYTHFYENMIHISHLEPIDELSDFLDFSQ